LAVSTKGEYFLGQKTFKSNESCNASRCTDFILRYVNNVVLYLAAKCKLKKVYFGLI